MSFDHFYYKGAKFAHTVHSESSLNYAENEFKVLDDDVFNVTYPKSGTNWMIEILNLIKHDGDPTTCQSILSYERSPWYETEAFKEQEKQLSQPRIISSHLPHQLFAKSFFTSKAKIVYTMRNPKDVIVSLFHFTKILYLFKEPENFQELIDNFVNGNALYGSWFDHIKGWMQMKDDSRFFYITYEELLKDPRGGVVRLCKFLGKQLDDAQIDSVVKHSTFSTMKENKMSNWTEMPSEVLDQTKGSFLRKGISGDWKNHFTVAQSEYFDKIYQEKMKDLNMSFYWEQL
ncbi:PREDICTED: sulfotransferase family cytosolic 2B member 1-like [Nanorana parkeri]|uniref:sulfotransferase family cytosolic 2B member 1-like n=1 Tax=Nanorana parkeri TaxID=125878 RepID=UPI000854BF0F|nr:PREDICTED: sulfotransferase family cytosolic 2B member 1-like [Nanorana parkeri]